MVRYAEISKEVALCAAAAERNQSDITLIAVSKTVGADAVRKAIAQGATDFGENRPEMLAQKAADFPEARWHFIGNIQSRQIDTIVRHATLIHSVFQMRHARKIDSCARSLGKVQDILIEVNVSGEATKSGCTPQEAVELVRACCELQNVRVCGLMTMAPQGCREFIEQTFDGLAETAARIRAELPQEYRTSFCELSMGMSEDWKYAIPRGATMIRVGRAIFCDSFKEELEFGL